MQLTCQLRLFPVRARLLPPPKLLVARLHSGRGQQPQLCLYKNSAPAATWPMMLTGCTPSQARLPCHISSSSTPAGEGKASRNTNIELESR